MNNDIVIVDHITRLRHTEVNPRLIEDLTIQIKNGIDPNMTNVVIGKSRQVGKSWANASLMAWKNLHSKYERARLRKESIKRIFNI